MSPLWAVVLALGLLQSMAIYVPVRQYEGATFFDGWAYYGNVDNTTWGASSISYPRSVRRGIE
jgi:hypothetical protein